MLAIEYKTGPLERIFSRLNMIETRHRERHLNLFSLRDSLKVAVELPQQIQLYVTPVSEEVKEWHRIRNLVCAGMVISQAQHKFVDLFGYARVAKSQPMENLGPVKRARHTAKDQALSTTIKSQNKRERSNNLVSKSERREDWRNSADQMVQKMRENKAMAAAGIDIAPRKTIFGTTLCPLDEQPLGRTAKQKQIHRQLEQHGKEAKALFDQEEQELACHEASSLSGQRSQRIMSPRGLFRGLVSRGHWLPLRRQQPRMRA